VNEAAPGFIDHQRQEFAMEGKNYDELLFGNALYRQSGAGKIHRDGNRRRPRDVLALGIAAGDYDNDGNEDVFITSGMGYPFYYWPNQLMMNKATVRSATGPPHLASSHQRVASTGKEYRGSAGCPKLAERRGCDFDGDGRLDIVTNNFNDRPYFFANRFPRQNYVEFRLTGTKSNRDGIGAVVRLWVGNKVMVREVSHAGGYSPIEPHGALRAR